MAPVKTLKIKQRKIILQKSSSNEGEDKDTKDEKKAVEAEAEKDGKPEEAPSKEDEE